MEWISVKDRLPAKPGKRRYEHVICWTYGERFGRRILAWNCEHEVWDDLDFDDVARGHDAVTHWIPIEEPEPPKE